MHASLSKQNGFFHYVQVHIISHSTMRYILIDESNGETNVIRQGEVFFVEDTHGKLHVYIVDCDTVKGKTGIFGFSLVST